MNKLAGKQVRVKLNDGANYVGTFVCMDGCLNVVLEDVVCFGESGITDTNDMEENTFSECFIRGNNLCYITPVEAD
jgi:small nuclear ribonucleoprotein (snRNP)-like protein